MLTDKLGGHASPRLKVAENYESMSRMAADFIGGEAARKPDILLCASGGGTPTRAYAIMAEIAAQKPGLFDFIRVLKIDEWGGLAMNHPATCEVYLQTKLLKPLGIAEDRYRGFHSRPLDPEEECRRMTQWLRGNGPIDVCVLGLGANGHLALNEPAETLKAHAHMEALAEESLRHPMLQGSGGLPEYGLTLGMNEIFGARRLLLLVNGAHKRAPLKRLMEGDISTWFPASLLWLHPDATILCDREAAAELA